MKRARNLHQDDAVEHEQEERASSRRRTSDSLTLGVAQPAADQPEPSVDQDRPKSDTESLEGNDAPSVSETVPASPTVSGSARSASPQQQPTPWGFVAYRTFYGDAATWALFQACLGVIITGEYDSIRSEGADPQGVTVKFIEDEATLKNATPRQIRTIFNPNYHPRVIDGENEEEPSDNEPPPTRDDGLFEEACLMIDEASMQSIIDHSKDSPGYVIAIDATSEVSEQWTTKEGTKDELIQCEYDGTIKVDVEYFLTEFYLRSLKDGVLTMGEIHGKPDEIWSGVELGGEDEECGQEDGSGASEEDDYGDIEEDGEEVDKEDD